MFHQRRWEPVMLRKVGTEDLRYAQQQDRALKPRCRMLAIRTVRRAAISGQLASQEFLTSRWWLRWRSVGAIWPDVVP